VVGLEGGESKRSHAGLRRIGEKAKGWWGVVGRLQRGGGMRGGEKARMDVLRSHGDGECDGGMSRNWKEAKN
jgi:hypothetical protein